MGPTLRLAVIIPVYNSSHLLEDTLQALAKGTRHPEELIVVDDGSLDSSAEVAERLGAQVLRMQHNVGPAVCRNRAAQLCESEVLVFLDADTCVHVDTLELIASVLSEDPTLTAVIGAYDDSPTDTRLCSQYRNLAHTYVHRSANRNALTFWSGCGAVRRAAFLRLGGFDERYRRPSIEDIEFGYRMSDAGLRILLSPEIQVTHSKRWTVRSCIKTDIVDRGVPWMTLLLRRGRVPNDLNLRIHHRVAVLLSGGAAACLVLSIRSLWWLPVSLSLAGLALSTDAGLLSFLYRRRGTRVLLVGAAMTLVQNLCKLISVGGALFLVFLRSRSSERGEPRSRKTALDSRSETEDEPSGAERRAA